MQLEIRNLTRIYRVKGGTDVKALDGISLRFPEKGLVFILGKSGSGKSTLLNVMGGLDKADDGEIIINGKSSKDFSGSEMDSYRNTYLGFIFQEYNILNDFTVAENIGLALELQHRKATPEKIDEILEEVDLKGLGKRRPNELSGGQKQRVAIARALVKEPRILFADEPTGALDSNTGKAVFETLKKLSKTRLVVVVSHDREFSEYFGDRVIELKDGSVISDISKIHEDADKVTEGIERMGGQLLRIERGHKLTDKDIEIINALVASSEQDAYISVDPRVNNAVETSAMISEDGKKQSFIDTDNEHVEQGQEEWKVIKSKFPFPAAFRMGAKSLKVKPFRLFMTIFLSTIAFTLFGVSATMAFTSGESLAANSIYDTGYDYAYLYKSTASFFGGMYGGETLSEAEVSMMNETYNLDLKYIYQERIDFGFSGDVVMNGESYIAAINGVTTIDQALIEKQGYSLLSGTLPQNDDDLLITAEMMKGMQAKDFYDKESGTTIDGNQINANTLLGKKLYGNKEYRICGVLDTKFDDSRFKKGQDNILNNLLSEFAQERAYSYTGLGYVKSPSGTISGTISPLTHDRNTINKLIHYLFTEYKAASQSENNPVIITIKNTAFSTAMTIDSLFGVLSTVFLWMGIVTAAFATLLFYSFISVSINNRRHEIGILRAVGARGWDVFKIFFSEAGIIATINFVLASVFTYLICFAVNTSMSASWTFSLTLLNPGIIVLLILLGIAAISGFLSAFLPTTRLAHQKPVDAIRGK